MIKDASRESARRVTYSTVIRGHQVTNRGLADSGNTMTGIASHTGDRDIGMVNECIQEVTGIVAESTISAGDRVVSRG